MSPYGVPEPGDLQALAWGSLRWSIARQARLLADASGGSAFYGAVVSGRDVVLTRGQVVSFVPPSMRPAKLDAYEWWLLKGDDELRPVP